MKVFVLSAGVHDYVPDIIGVYSTEQQAEIEGRKSTCSYFITPLELDAELNVKELLKL